MVDISEQGVTGLRQNSGFVSEEFLPQLQGTKANKVYREMADNEPIIGGILLAFEQVAGQLDWKISEPEDASDDEKKATEFIQSAWEDMEESFDSTLSSILSMLPFGFSFFEINYKLRQGAKPKKGNAESRYDDGKIGWKSLAVRAQESLVKWEFADNGEITHYVQQDPITGSIRRLPLEKGLLFRTSEYKNNPQGRSMLRNAYVPYYYLKRFREIEAVGVERDLAGMPIIDVPAEWLSDKATPGQQGAIQEFKKIVEDVRANKRAGLVFPVAYDEHGNKVLDFRLLASTGNGAGKTDTIITRYKQEIAMSVLADFVLLGHEQVGSFALSTTKVELWVSVVASICKSIADVITKHAIKKLLRLNGMPFVNPPRLTYGEVQNIDLSSLGGFITSLVNGGLLNYDPTLEQWVRDVAGMPPVDEEFAAIREQKELEKLQNTPTDPMAPLQTQHELGQQAADADHARSQESADAQAKRDRETAAENAKLIPKPEDAKGAKDDKKPVKKEAELAAAELLDVIRRTSR
jgi:hypothetical protein